jgi:hypothetical protein
MQSRIGQEHQGKTCHKQRNGPDEADWDSKKRRTNLKSTKSPTSPQIAVIIASGCVYTNYLLLTQVYLYYYNIIILLSRIDVM